MTDNVSTLYRKLLKDCETHTEHSDYVSIVDKRKYCMNRKTQEQFFHLQGEMVMMKDKDKFLSSVCERMRLGGYTMLRADVDNKERVESDKIKPHKMFELSYVNNLIKDIQEYLQKHLNNLHNTSNNNNHNNPLHCVLLTKDPYISKEKDGKYYNKHGFHLQFVNCFLLKEDLKRIAEHFHEKDKSYDKCVYYGSWLLYGSKKKEVSGTYLADTVFLENGRTETPSKYFKTYPIYDYVKQDPIQYDRPIEYYYPRIFSIHSGNRNSQHILKPEMNESTKRHHQLDYSARQVNSEHYEKYGGEIAEIVETFLKDDMNDCLAIRAETESGFQLKFQKEYVCPVDTSYTHRSRGAYMSIFNGAVYFGCYRKECLTSGGKRMVLVKRFAEVEEKKTDDKSEDGHTYSEIRGITPKKRTKKMREFYDSVNQSISQRNIEYLFNTKDKNRREIAQKCFVGKHRDTKEYTHGHDLFGGEEKIVVIRAGLGKGKTEATTGHINESDYEQIVVFTPRVSYAQCCHARFQEECPKHDWKLYKTEKKSFIQHNFVVCQAESLHRLHLDSGKKCLLVIDEVEAFLTQLTSTDTHKENHRINLDTFVRMMKSASKIICLDAFISQRTLQTIHLMGFRNEYKFYDFTSPCPKRFAIKKTSMEDFVTSLVSDLRGGKRIFFFCSSINKLKDKFLPIIQQNFPKLLVKTYHSENKQEVSELVNCVEVWTKADVVLTTATITVGCNYDDPNHFDKLYCYAGATSKNIVRDMFQSFYRVRTFKDKEMVYFLDPKRNLSPPTFKKGIERDIDDKSKLLKEQFANKFSKIDYLNDTPPWLRELVCYNRFEWGVGIMNLEALFARYLKECNYSPKSDESIDTNILIEVEFEPIVKPLVEYKKIPPITSNEMKELRKKKMIQGLTPEENAKWVKFWFQQCVLDLPEESEQAVWDLYCDKGKGKFRNLQYEKGLEQKSITIRDIIDTRAENSNYADLNKGLSLQCEMIQQMSEMLGLKNSQQIGTHVSHKQLKGGLENFHKHKDKLHTVFNLRKDRSKIDKEFDLVNAQTLINKVWRTWGFSKLHANPQKKKTIEGKRINVAGYEIKKLGKELPEMDDLYKYIKPKTSSKGRPEIKVIMDVNVLPMEHSEDEYEDEYEEDKQERER